MYVISISTTLTLDANAGGYSYFTPADSLSSMVSAVQADPNLQMTVDSTVWAGEDIPLASGDILQWNTADQKFKPAQLPSGGATRTTSSVVTSSIADGVSENAVVPSTGKAGQLLAIETDQAAWVTVYASQASRTADANRIETTSPAPGSGVIAEVITTGPQRILVTPCINFFNDEATPASELYLKVVNKSGSAQAITTTLTVVPTES